MTDSKHRKYKVALRTYHMKSQTHRDTWELLASDDTVGAAGAFLSSARPQNSYTLSYEGPFTLDEAHARMDSLAAQKARRLGS